MDASAGTAWPAAALAAAALAMIGALALACFVKLYGAVFQGLPRTTHHHPPHDPSAAMLIPMIVPALGCLLLGLFPQAVFPVVQRAVSVWAPSSAAPIPPWTAPLAWISAMGLGLMGAILVLFPFIRAAVRRRAAPKSMDTWCCGYTRPTPRMQYTSTGFAQMLVALFARLIGPRIRTFSLKPPFPTPCDFEMDVPDAILDRIVLPFFRLTDAPSKLRLLQQDAFNYLLTSSCCTDCSSGGLFK
jgi:hydrogenase-4 component B